MIHRIGQLLRVGRFGRWSGSAAFGRLTLVSGPNGSGKSTIARTLRAASDQDAEGVLERRTLGAVGAPEVVLEHAGGTLRFDGTAWRGEGVRLRVYDLDFVEGNVYVGRSTSKEQRKGLLEVALGESLVRHKRAIDELDTRSRSLSRDRRAIEAGLRPLASEFGLALEEFLALEPVQEPVSALEAARSRSRDAELASEIARRPRFESLPAPPAIDFEAIGRVLSRTVRRVSEQAETAVRAHLAGRLGGRGEEWVRQGLAHAGGTTCPFCAQDLRAVELVRMYRVFFDDAYARHVEELDAVIAGLAGIDSWWTDLKRIGTTNVKEVASRWTDLPGLVRPDFDSRRRQAQVEEVKGGLGRLLDARRARPTEPVEGGGDLDRARAAWREVEGAVEAYGRQAAEANRAIEARCRDLASVAPDAARRTLRLLEAAVRRHDPEVAVQADECRRLETERALVADEKKRIDDDLRIAGRTQLEDFAARLSANLARIGTTFRVAEVGTERSGGAPGARLAVEVGPERLDVSSSAGEGRIALVLSDGDRAALALAVFLAGLEGGHGLAEEVVVFDDPETALDPVRRRAIAGLLAEVGSRCRQLVVLSHEPEFLDAVAGAWRGERAVRLELGPEGLR